MRPWSLLFGLAGCAGLSPYGEPVDGLVPGDTANPGTSDADTDTDTDSDSNCDTDADTDTDVEITDVSPAFGTNGGGEEVTIEGGPFDSSTLVFFDGVEADDIVSVNAGEIVAVTPSTTATGYVDVEVEGDDGTGRAPAAYQFWEDGTGKYGAYGEIGWYELMGGYWEVPSPPPYGFAQVYLTAPSNDDYWKVWFTPTNNSCSLDFVPTVSPYQPDSPSLEMTAGNKTVSMAQDAANPWLYRAINLTAAEVGLGTNYDLEPAAGASPDWPSFTATDFAVVPANGPGVTLPAIDDATPPHVTESSFVFNWAGPYDGDFVAISAVRSRPNAMGVFTPVEYVTCIADDDGTFKIPSGSFSAWSATEDAFYVYLGRAQVLGGTIPYDNSDSGVMGVYWEVGFAIAD